MGACLYKLSNTCTSAGFIPIVDIVFHCPRPVFKNLNKLSRLHIKGHRQTTGNILQTRNCWICPLQEFLCSIDDVIINYFSHAVWLRKISLSACLRPNSVSTFGLILSLACSFQHQCQLLAPLMSILSSFEHHFLCCMILLAFPCG